MDSIKEQSICQYYKLKMLDFKNLLFPDYCLNCQNGEEIVCENCLRQTYSLAKYLKKNYSFNALLPYFCRDEMFWVAKALHLLKYEGYTRLAKYLNQLLVPFLPDLPIVTVPISAAKRRKRGFNQLELILRQSGKLKIANILVKKTDNKAQMSLDSQERKKNVLGQYQVVYGAVVPEKLVIFDDMLTTGNTLDEICKVLKNCGAKEIERLTLLGKIEVTFTKTEKNAKIAPLTRV